MKWNDMTGDDQVRRCAVCAKNVYNLSGMTRAESAKLIQDTDVKLCARYFVRPDGTIITSQCPKVVRDQIRNVRKFAVKASAILAPLAIFGTAFATPYIRQDQNTPYTQIATMVKNLLKAIGFTFEEPEALTGKLMVPPPHPPEILGRLAAPPKPPIKR
jgi:hypothetical protein